MARATTAPVLAASSSNGTVLARYWSKVWHTRVPPKVRGFFWRLVKGIVPTRRNLERRHVNIDEVCCVLCGKDVEDEFHLF